MVSEWHYGKRPAPPSRPESIHSDDVAHLPAQNDDRPRKRVRKGTKSCWECKRRKVKCQLSTEDVPVCSGCLSRGTTCVSQEFPEERDAGSGLQIGERLGRVERLLETIVSKMAAFEEEENTQKMLTPRSTGNEVLDESAVEVHPPPAESPYQGLFNNVLVGHTDPVTPVTTPGVRTPYSSAKPTSGCCRTTKAEKQRQTLLDMFPADEDLDFIFSTNYNSVLLNSMRWSVKEGELDMNKFASKVPPMDPLRLVSIARRLLYVAVCLQQIDPSLDVSRLSIQGPIKAYTERVMATVTALVTGNDELATSSEGIECLILQGMYSINDGTPRRAWLTFRRALNLGQLMGLSRLNPNDSEEGKRLWNQMVQGDRYMSLLLGLPAGSNYDHFEPEENFQNPNINKEYLFGRKLGEVSLKLIQRNQKGATPAYTGTQEIDDHLDALSKEMPSSWWEVPSNISTGVTEETNTLFDRLIMQIWFFQMQGLVHLPFMLRAATERRFEYSKFCCLKACREVMWRYLALRKSYNKSFCCKVIDFGALTATVALFLGLFSPSNKAPGQEDQDEADRTLINMVYEVMEDLVKNKGEVVAAQSLTVIKSLLAAEQPSNHDGGNLRLTIPYFGTISIVRPQPKMRTPAQTPTQQTSDFVGQDQSQMPLYGMQRTGSELPNSAAGTQGWANMQVPLQTTPGYPAVSFQSTYFNEFPPTQQTIPAVGWNEADTLFFDSLLNADIDTNWTF